MNRRRFLAAGLATCGLAAAQQTIARRKPNVVMFMTDDHGAWAVGHGGCGGVATPHLDALAAMGVRFSRAYACTPVCSPSRMTYLTGMLPSGHGVHDFLRPEDSVGPRARPWLSGLPTYSEALAAEGYTVGIVGKWHMGADEFPQAGFTDWTTTNLWIKGRGYKDPAMFRGGKSVAHEGFLTDIEGDLALDFLDRQQTTAAPFYLLVAFDAPHAPYDFQPKQDRAPYDEPSPRCFPAAPMHAWQMGALKRHYQNPESQRSYAALVTGVDRNVGRVIQRLTDLGILEETLVVFTADQGHNCGHHGVWGKGNGTVPFNMYEESVRVPLIWSHPGRIPSGRVLSPMVSSYDYLPTLLDYLGVSMPPEPRRVGRSYAGFLRGEPPAWRNRLYFEYGNTRAVRTEHLKLIERSDGWPSELFDLETDPGETRNVIGDEGYDEPRQSLHADLERFFRESGAPRHDDWRSTTRQSLTRYSRTGAMVAERDADVEPKAGDR